MNVLLSPIYARRRRPIFLVFVAIVVLCFLYTTNRLLFSASSAGILSPIIPGIISGLKGEPDDLSMSYGTASRPNFLGLGELTKLGELPRQHLPAPASSKRLVII